MVDNGFDRKKCIIVAAKSDYKMTTTTNNDEDDDNYEIYCNVFTANNNSKNNNNNTDDDDDDYGRQTQLEDMNEQLQRRLGKNAFAFLECSAVSGEGIDTVFDNAFRLAVGDGGMKFKTLINAW